MSKFETTIIGSVGRDPDVRDAGGKKVASFTVATKVGKKTVWVKVSVWEKLADICSQYVKKGIKVYVRGTLQSDENGLPRTYEKDGSTKASQFELTGYEVLLLTKVDVDEVKDDVRPEVPEEIPF